MIITFKYFVFTRDFLVEHCNLLLHFSFHLGSYLTSCYSFEHLLKLHDYEFSHAVTSWYSLTLTSTRCFSPADMNCHNLPGVPTIISGLSFKDLSSCFTSASPPIIWVTLTLIYLATAFRWLLTWNKITCQIIKLENQAIRNNCFYWISGKPDLLENSIICKKSVIK